MQGFGQLGINSNSAAASAVAAAAVHKNMWVNKRICGLIKDYVG
jgi:hypothetical protein